MTKLQAVLVQSEEVGGIDSKDWRAHTMLCYLKRLWLPVLLSVYSFCGSPSRSHVAMKKVQWEQLHCLGCNKSWLTTRCSLVHGCVSYCDLFTTLLIHSNSHHVSVCLGLEDCSWHTQYVSQQKSHLHRSFELLQFLFCVGEESEYSTSLCCRSSL